MKIKINNFKKGNEGEVENIQRDQCFLSPEINNFFGKLATIPSARWEQNRLVMRRLYLMRPQLKPPKNIVAFLVD